MHSSVIIQNTKTMYSSSARIGSKRVPTTAAGNSSAALLVAGKPGLNGTMKTPIKVLLVDDHPIVRRGVASCLAKHSNLLVVGEAADGREAIEKARELNPDVIMMDVDMPQMDGLAVTSVLRKEFPAIKVLMLSMYRDTDYIVRILQSGAVGYVLKDAPAEELVRAVETVYSGESYFSSEVARVAMNQFVRGATEGPSTTNLTNREREVLIHIADGFSNKEIASRLNVGVRTVETHRERIMRKLNIRNVAGLTKFAIAKGLISLRD
jgi:DNA-binding NarL/FixJ family response regulator